MLTTENYEAWKQEYEKGISTDANRIMFETFEALREVAKAAEGALIYDMRRAIWTLDDDEAQDMQNALDALPAWVTQDE